LGGIVVSPEGCHLDDFATCPDVHDLEPPANDPCVTKALLDLLWRRVGGNVKVFRMSTHEQIADGTADNIGFESRALELRHDLQRTFREGSGVESLGERLFGRHLRPSAKIARYRGTLSIG
jgi:hypothetical protein